MDAQVESVTDTSAILGEGPIWDAESGALWWVDILGERLHRFDPALDQDEVFDVGEMIGTVVPRSSGGVALALDSGFAFFDVEAGTLERIADPEADRATNRFNEGKCDPAGRFWAGTMSKSDEPRQGALYSLEADGTVVKRLSDISISNGIVWSSDARTMYYIDTPTMRIDGFDYDLESGAISNRRPVIRVPREMGYPDGMAIDSEDRLWVGMWGGRRIACFDPLSGQGVGEIEVPADNVTACAFGGPDLQDLYITTARVGLTDQQLAAQPHAGGLFRTRVDVPGVKSAAYAG